MLDVKALLNKLIPRVGTNYIKIGDKAICWGELSWPIIGQNSNTNKPVTYPITFQTVPAVFHTLRAGHGQVRSLWFEVHAESVTGHTVILSNTGSALTSSSTSWWLAIGNVGGYSVD